MILHKIVFKENFITRVYRFPGLSRTCINFPGLSRISRTRMNPVYLLSRDAKKYKIENFCLNWQFTKMQG